MTCAKKCQKCNNSMHLQMPPKSVLSPWLKHTAKTLDVQSKPPLPTMLDRWLVSTPTLEKHTHGIPLWPAEALPLHIMDDLQSETHGTTTQHPTNIVSPNHAFNLHALDNSGQEPDQHALDLYDTMPALNSDSEDCSITSESSEADQNREVNTIMQLPFMRNVRPHSLEDVDTTHFNEANASDGYLWNLVPPINNQYLDLDTTHINISSSESSEASESSNSFVCNDDTYTDEQLEQLQLMFPVTTRRLQNANKNHQSQLL